MLARAIRRAGEEPLGFASWVLCSWISSLDRGCFAPCHEALVGPDVLLYFGGSVLGRFCFGFCGVWCCSFLSLSSCVRKPGTWGGPGVVILSWGLKNTQPRVVKDLENEEVVQSLVLLLTSE